MNEETKATLWSWTKSIAPWVGVALAVYFYAGHLQGGAMGSGEQAPALSVTTEAGEEFVLANAEGVTVLNFWESWCPPCRAEAPVLQRAHESLEGRGRVIGLPMERRSIPAARRLGMHYDQALVSHEVARRFQVTSLPTTFVVRADGTIARSFVGAVTDGQLADAIADAE